MRVTVNLSFFFHDHRSLAKIFINKKMACIKNVENHISEIFSIHNFYLKCENQYLPPTESIQILNNDDIVWAVPLEEQSLVMSESNSSVYFTPLENVIKKKKKKHQSENKHLEEPMELKINHVTQKGKKNKKRNHKLSEERNDCLSDENNSICDIKVKNKFEKNTTSENEIEQVFQKDSGRDSLDSSKNSKNEEIPEVSKVKSLVHSFEGKQIDFTKHLSEAPTRVNDRKINIVKTVVISHINDSFINETENTNNCSDGEKKIETSSKQLSEEKNSVIPVEESELKSQLIQTETSSSFSCNNSTFNESDTVKNVTKRKRKRVRRRKAPVNNKNDIGTADEEPVYKLIHEPMNVLRSAHIRFEEDQSLPNTTTDLPVDGNLNSNPVNNSEVKESPKNEFIEINESIVDVNDIEPNDDAPKYLSTLKEYDAKQIEECILKQPITKNLEPRLGDVIAFKILRISDSYTPVVSSTIVGRVINYNPENKSITFLIVYGHDQCALPQGKFTLDQDDQDKQVVDADTHYECLWSMLFEPRLIFP